MLQNYTKAEVNIRDYKYHLMSKNKAPLYFLCLYCMQSKRMLSSIHDAYAVFNVAFGKDDGIQEICKDFGVEKSYKIAT